MRAIQAQAMADYNQWMNRQLYELCSSLSDEERKTDRRAFFGSIHGTLNHLLLGDKIWLGRFTANLFDVQSLDYELHTDFVDLRRERQSTDEEIIQWTNGLTDQSLLEIFEFESFVNPQRRRCQFWVTVTHFFNHQTHHRGQLTTLLSQCGIDCGVTDFIWTGELMKSMD